MENTRDVTKTDDDAFSRIFLKLFSVVLARDEDHKTREQRTKEFFIFRSLSSKRNGSVKV